MNEFRNKLIKAIDICNAEIANRKNNISGESTEEQLEKVILPELNYLLTIIEDNQELSPVQERFLCSFANAFTIWGWDMQHPTELFVLLTELNNEYKQL